MKTKLFSIIFSIVFLFLVHLNGNGAATTSYHTITAHKVHFDYAYVKVSKIVYVNVGLTPPENLVKMYIPLSSIAYVEEIKEEGK